MDSHTFFGSVFNIIMIIEKQILYLHIGAITFMWLFDTTPTITKSNFGYWLWKTDYDAAS